jgi:WD40 repeat protein/serine/threonine protein kinase
MEQNTAIEDLLLRWEELRAQGQLLSVAELCRDCPEYEEEVARRIQALRAIGTILDLPSRATDGPTDNGAAPLPRVPGYEVLGELGRGGMGVVYKAQQHRPERLVALKMILSGAHAGSQELARFRSEAEKTARLQHPHIVQIFEVNEHEGRPYFSLEYISGGSLAQKLNGTPLPGRQAAELLETLSRAMQAAHQAGIIHRDLKPGNILLTTEGMPKIADFGLAKRLNAETQQTPSGAVLGTPSYMAPEQALGKSKTLGPAVDVYALGAILYEMLTGRPPFKGESSWDTVQQVLAGDPVPPRRLQPNVPRDLETICLKCLQKEAHKRYASAAALGDDLRRFLEGRPILGRQVGGGEKLWRWCRRNPAVASLITAVPVLLLAGTGISAYFAVKSATFAVQALQEKDRADQRAEDFRRQLYISNVNRAISEWQNNKVSLAERLLDACPEDLRGWEWRYAQRLCYQDKATTYGYFVEEHYYGHRAHHTIAFSPDSQWIAAMDWDHILKLWDTATGTRVRAMKGDTGLAFSLAFSPDGKWIASGNYDRTVRVWNTETGELVHTLRGHSFLVCSVHFPIDGKRIISAGPVLMDNHEEQQLSQMEIITWDTATGQQLSRKVVADANIIRGGVAFSPDGSQFIAAGNDESRQVGPSIVGYLGSALGQGPFLAAAAIRPGRHDEDTTLKLGNTDTGQCVHTSYSEPVIAAAFSPNGKRAATAGLERVWLWDAATGKAIRSLQGHTGPVSSLAFSPDGARLVSGCEDSSVRLWDATTGKELATFRGHTANVQSVAFSPDGQWLASAGDDGVVKLWDALRGAEPVTLSGGDGSKWLSDVIFNADGQVLYSFSGWSTNGAPDGIKLWDWHRTQQVRVFPDSAGWLIGMAMSPDKKRIASADRKGTITFWDAVSGRRLERWAVGAGPIQSLAFSPDGKALGYTSGNKVTVIDADNRREIAIFQSSGSALYSLTFSPDNRRIGAVARDQVIVWDRASGQKLFSYAASTYDHRLWFFGSILAFSSDGKLAAPDKNRISIRDALTGREILNLPGHSGPVVCLAFSPDGKRLASGSSSDFDVKLWDATSGQETLALRGHVNTIESVAFSPNGDRLASCSVDGTVKIWTATGVSADRVYKRVAHDWVQASIGDASGVENKQALEDPDNLREPARTFAIQMARHRTEQLGRIPVFYSRLGNDFSCREWTALARASFTFAQNAFRRNLGLDSDKASAHGDFAFFLVSCPEPQFRDAAKALVHAEKAIALDPANADYAALLGMAQYRAGEWQAAVDTLEKAIARAPVRFAGHARIFLSMAHQQLGHVTEARRCYEQALPEIKKDSSLEELRQLRTEAATLLGIREVSSLGLR